MEVAKGQECGGTGYRIAEDSRTTRVGSKTTWRRLDVEVSAPRRSSAAVRPIASAGWRTEESGIDAAL